MNWWNAAVRLRRRKRLEWFLSKMKTTSLVIYVTRDYQKAVEDAEIEAMYRDVGGSE
jgi:hypothetical protein